MSSDRGIGLMQRDLRADVLDRLARWSVLGQHRSASGALLLGHLSHIGPAVWLHKVFPPIENTQAEEVAACVGAYKGSQIAVFHAFFNGINLFSSNFYLLGRRTSFVRSSDFVLPWDIVDCNLETQHKLDEGQILVGGSDALEDGVDLVECVGGGIVAVARHDWSHTLCRWHSLEQCVIDEVDRLSTLFDDAGQPISADLLSRYDL